MLAMTVRRTASPSTHSSSTSWFAPLIPDHTVDTITDTGRWPPRYLACWQANNEKHLAFQKTSGEKTCADGHALVNTAGRMAELHAESAGNAIADRAEPTKASPRYLNRFTAATISSNSGVSPGANSSGRSGRPAIGAPSGAFSVVSTSNPSFAGELP